jgi:hypothetical protein
MPRKLVLAVPFGLFLALNVSNSDAGARPFLLEVFYGALDGPGEGFGTPSDRRARDIESARVRGLRLSWALDETWQVSGGYSRTNARYANLESVGCPLTGGIADPLFGNLCLSLDDRSPGIFEDRIDEGKLSVARFWPLGGAVRIETELGLHHARWRAADDLEARLVATCQVVADLRDFPQSTLTVPGCRSVKLDASETDLLAAVQAHLADAAGWTASAGVHYRGQRHRIYRSDVLDRFEESNCADPDSCRLLGVREERYFARIPRSSWVWYSVRLGRRMTDTVEVFGEWVGGGTRDWDGGQVGLILHF